jgi:flagellar FliL protein
MATDKTNEAAPAEQEAVPAQAEGSPPAEAPAAEKGGGIGAWLPLITTVVAMPVLAYLTTAFVLLPKVQKAIAASDTTSANTPATKASEVGKPAEKAGGARGGAKAKEGATEKATVPINKILVNLSGSMGTRYLLTSLSLEGESANFKETIEKNQAQLIDLAQGILGSKTISDLEKPGARNVIRNELLTVFNNALGDGTVKQIYITEFAVQ